jgi:cytochrome c
MKSTILFTLWSFLLVAGGCSNSRIEEAARVSGGNPLRGKQEIVRFGCPACHEIPGIPTARSRVGPSLRNIVAQEYLAGQISNTPNNMVHWVRVPQEIKPNSAMPNLGLSDEEARNITAYLYSQP